MDNGVGGGFITIAGGDLGVLLDQEAMAENLGEDAETGVHNSEAGAFSYEIQRGAVYRFRYRASNVNGWSDYSPMTYLMAATIPDAPLPVTLTSS